MTIADPLARSRASEIEGDGALKGVFGENGPRLDQPPLVLASGDLDLVNGTTNAGSLVLPFATKLWIARYIVTADVGTGTPEIRVGTEADPDAYAAVTLEATAADGDVGDVTITAASIPADTHVLISCDSGASSTGTARVTIVLTPRVA